MSSRPWLDNSLELLTNSIKFFCTHSEGYYKLSLICIDNSLEIGLKTYVKRYLNKRKIKLQNNQSFWLKDTKFWQLVKFFEENNKITTDFARSINHYHDIRNDLYHEGNTIPRKNDISDYVVKVISIFNDIFDQDYKIVKDEDREVSFLIEYINFVQNRDLDNYKEDIRFQNIQDIIRKVVPPTYRQSNETYIECIGWIVELQTE